MKNKTLYCLLMVVLLVCVIPWQGKRLLPAWFGSSLVQWSSVGLLAVLCPIGAVLSLSLLLGQRCREGYFYFIGFALPVFVFFFFWGITRAFFAKAAVMMQPQYKEFDAIAKLVEGARDRRESPERRLKAASNVYILWGVVTVLLAADDQMVAYTPTMEDKRLRQKDLGSRTSIEKSLTVVHWQMKQTPWIFGSFLCTSTLVLFVGLGFYAFKRRQEEA